MSSIAMRDIEWSDLIARTEDSKSDREGEDMNFMPSGALLFASPARGAGNGENKRREDARRLGQLWATLAEIGAALL
jgi:hypothetical protein